MGIAVMIFAIPLLAIFVKSDIAQALADAIRHNSGASQSGSSHTEVLELRAEVEAMRADLEDVHELLAENAERLDFAERTLGRSTTPHAEGGA